MQPTVILRFNTSVPTKTELPKLSRQPGDVNIVVWRLPFKLLDTSVRPYGLWQSAQWPAGNALVGGPGGPQSSRTNRVGLVCKNFSSPPALPLCSSHSRHSFEKRDVTVHDRDRLPDIW